jgi:hypothetical protein
MSDSVQQVDWYLRKWSEDCFDFLGRRVAVVRSVDSSPISCFTIHECEGPSRLSTRPRRFIFTGHDNGLLNNFNLTFYFFCS